MRLRHMVKRRDLLTAEGHPVWLWHTARKRDLPWIRVEGLIWRPTVWLAASRKAAIGFHPGGDRLIIRVNTSMLAEGCLFKDVEWRKWVASLRTKNSTVPPQPLLQYWARLRKYDDPDGAARLGQALKGSFEPQQLRQDLRTQIARVRPDQLWGYTDRVPPEALSVASDAGFYVSLRTTPPDGDSTQAKESGDPP
jgi:hypothetical protein